MATFSNPNLKNTPLTAGFWNEFYNQGGTGGNQYEYLVTKLKDILNTGDSSVKKARQVSTGQINKAYDTSQSKISQMFADKGTFGSGVHAGASVDLEGGRSSAIAENEANLESLNQRAKENAIQVLFGLNEGQASRQFGTVQLQENIKKMFENLEFQKKSQPSDFMQLLGSLIGAGGQVGAAALLK